MQPTQVLTQRRTLDLEISSVLRNTYLLLSLTLAFSALTAWFSAAMGLPHPGLLISLLGCYGLMFLTERNRNSPLGLVFAFAFTGFMGYILGPLLNLVVATQGMELVMTALGGTAATFLALSAYVLVTRKDMSFLGGMMMAGFVVLVVMMIAGFFIQTPALHLAMSALFILFSSGAILMQTSAIIHGGERNYISATVSLYVSIYNIFISLLSLLGMSRD